VCVCVRAHDCVHVCVRACGLMPLLLGEHWCWMGAGVRNVGRRMLHRRAHPKNGHTYMHTRIHVRMHTHAHTRTHADALPPPPAPPTFLATTFLGAGFSASSLGLPDLDPIVCQKAFGSCSCVAACVHGLARSVGCKPKSLYFLVNQTYCVFTCGMVQQGGAKGWQAYYLTPNRREESRPQPRLHTMGRAFERIHTCTRAPPPTHAHKCTHTVVRLRTHLCLGGAPLFRRGLLLLRRLLSRQGTCCQRCGLEVEGKCDGCKGDAAADSQGRKEAAGWEGRRCDGCKGAAAASTQW